MGTEFTLPDGYAEIIQGVWPKNFDEKLFRVVEIFPENQDGIWHQRFELVAKTETEIENEQKAYFAFLEQQKGTVAAQELTASGSAPNVIE